MPLVVHKKSIVCIYVVVNTLYKSVCEVQMRNCLFTAGTCVRDVVSLLSNICTRLHLLQA